MLTNYCPNCSKEIEEGLYFCNDKCRDDYADSVMPIRHGKEVSEALKLAIERLGKEK